MRESEMDECWNVLIWINLRQGGMYYYWHLLLIYVFFMVGVDWSQLVTILEEYTALKSSLSGRCRSFVLVKILLTSRSLFWALPSPPLGLRSPSLVFWSPSMAFWEASIERIFCPLSTTSREPERPIFAMPSGQWAITSRSRVTWFRR